jgi:cardiolipin synthase C
MNARLGLLLISALAAGGCASMSGRNFPWPPPVEIVHEPNAALTQPFAGAAMTHHGASGFRLYTVGVDGLLLRLELIAQAKSSIDLQYYIFHGDESGRLLNSLATVRTRSTSCRVNARGA